MEGSAGSVLFLNKRPSGTDTDDRLVLLLARCTLATVARQWTAYAPLSISFCCGTNSAIIFRE